MKKNKQNNTINVLFPYRTPQGVWLYNDEDLGVYGEAFVAGSSEVIDYLLRGETECISTISSKPFPGYTALLNKIPNTDIEGWYQIEGNDMPPNWLCSKVLDYFPDYPDQIYVKIEGVKA